MFAFDTSFTNAMQRHFFQIHAIHHGIQLLKACHVEVAKSFILKHGTFLERICNACRVLTHIHIKKVQVFVASCLLHNNSLSIVDLTTILVKLHFETFKIEFIHRNETILHFWNMKNLGDGCVREFASHLHCGFDVPLANGVQNGVITHEHRPWGNVFVGGKPFLFECHVLRCTKIDNPIIHGMIISTQCHNKHLLVIFTSLISFSFSSFFFFKQIFTKCPGFLQ
jgi:hypothetical protein